MTLVAHLRHHFVFAGLLAHGAGFIDVVGQRLFAIDVLACPNGRQRCTSMRMVRRGDEDRVDLFVQFVEHLAEVPILLGLRGLDLFQPLHPALALRVVDIDKCNHALVGHRLVVGFSLVVRADQGHAEFRVGRTLGQEGGNPKHLGPDGHARHNRRIFEQFSPTNTHAHSKSPPYVTDQRTSKDTRQHAARDRCIVVARCAIIAARRGLGKVFRCFRVISGFFAGNLRGNEKRGD